MCNKLSCRVTACYGMNGLPGNRARMKPIYIDYLNALDIEALAMTDDEILAAIETAWPRRAAARR